MKALVKTRKGPGHLELCDVDDPTTGRDEVNIAVKAAGICSTDIHIRNDDYPNYPPVILGHELSGVVREVGANVTDLCVGDRVTCQTGQVLCGTCLYCRTGATNLCLQRRSIGSGVNGGFAEYCVVPRNTVHSIPDSVDFDSAAVTEPLACCVNGMEHAGLSLGDVVVISGPGTVGLLMLQLAKAHGAKAIVCGVSSDHDKLKLAHTLGADCCINVQKDNPVPIVMNLTAGYGADLAIECAGVAASVRQCFDLLRKRGRYVSMGLTGKEVPVPIDIIVRHELSLCGSFSHTWSSFRKALDLMQQHRVNAKAIIAKRLALKDWQQGFDSMGEGKILLYPSE